VGIYKKKFSSGFTLIEIVIVLFVIALATGVLLVRMGTFGYWRQEGFIRSLSETIVFLHHQAIVDQAFYRMDFNLEKNTYQVGVIRPESDIREDLSAISTDAGNLTLELAAFLSPAIGKTHTLIPPPSMPSLAEKVEFPPEVRFQDIRTMRGKKLASEGGEAYILFSPRGFSEFAVLHLEDVTGQPVTILVNPFSGNTSIYREYKDFQWTYGKKEQ
jgi:prepilin-type N-terminal cleavage/methylation domain-containing protein